MALIEKIHTHKINTPPIEIGGARNECIKPRKLAQFNTTKLKGFLFCQSFYSENISI